MPVATLVNTSVFLVLAVLFGPRYGLIAQELRHRAKYQANDGRGGFSYIASMMVVNRQGKVLLLTPKGRSVAQEIFEPWRES